MKISTLTSEVFIEPFQNTLLPNGIVYTYKYNLVIILNY